MALDIGTEAPDFTLRDQNREQVTLSSFRGEHSVLLVFYPFAFSKTCTGELCQVRDELETYENAEVAVLGISVDHVHALKAWAAAQSYSFPLLADFWPHGAVAQAYGAFNDKGGFAVRGTFLIDMAGIIRFAEVKENISEPRDQEGWKKAMAALPA